MVMWTDRKGNRMAGRMKLIKIIGVMMMIIKT